MKSVSTVAIMIASLAVVGPFTSAHADPNQGDHAAVAKVKYADVQKFFNANCIRCHGAERPRGGINLTSYDMVMKGGEDGPIVKPGDVANSYLIKAVTGNGARIMPPRGPKVDDKTEKMLESWVKAGAKNK